MKYLDIYNDKENPRAQEKRIKGMRCEPLKPLKMSIAEQCAVEGKIEKMLSSLKQLGMMFEFKKDNIHYDIVYNTK